MALPIPKKYIPEIDKVRALSDSTTAELVQALENSPVMSRSEEMATRIAEYVPGVPHDDLIGIVDLIYALYHVREYSEFGRSQFLKELVEGIREQASPAIAKEELAGIRDRFRRLLSIDTLNSISKAISLQRDGEHLYCSAKIVSDIRPVFGPDVGSSPVAATIVHTLKLGYHERGEHKEFFILLDGADLVKLQEVIERAQDKSEALDEFLKQSKLPRLGA